MHLFALVPECHSKPPAFYKNTACTLCTCVLLTHLTAYTTSATALSVTHKKLPLFAFGSRWSRPLTSFSSVFIISTSATRERTKHHPLPSPPGISKTGCWAHASSYSLWCPWESAWGSVCQEPWYRTFFEGSQRVRYYHSLGFLEDCLWISFPQGVFCLR